MRSSLLVDAERRVERDVQREERRRTDPEEPVDEQQDAGREQVPEALVEEGRVEGLRVDELGRAVLEVDLERPGHVGRLAEELLVPPVARRGRSPARRAGRARPRPANGAHALPGAPNDDRAGDAAEQDPAPHAEAALPDREDAPPLVRDLVPARDHVVEARADDAEGDAPDRHAQDEIPVAAAARPAQAGQSDARGDAEQQHQPVHVQRQRAELEDARVGRRNRCEGDHGAGILPARGRACLAARAGSSARDRPSSRAARRSTARCRSMSCRTAIFAAERGSYPAPLELLRAPPLDPLRLGLIDQVDVSRRHWVFSRRLISLFGRRRETGCPSEG